MQLLKANSIKSFKIFWLPFLPLKQYFHPKPSELQPTFQTWKIRVTALMDSQKGEELLKLHARSEMYLGESSVGLYLSHP